MRRCLLSLSALFVCLAHLSVDGSETYAQDHTADPVARIVLNFRFDRAAIDSLYMDNGRSIAALDSLLGDPALLSRVESVSIVSSSSPDGHPDYNTRLSQRRADAVCQYLTGRFPTLDPSKITRGQDHSGYWDGLRAKAEADGSIPGREALIRMIDREDMTDLAKSRMLTSMNGGRTYSYLYLHVLPRLRYGMIAVVRFTPLPEPAPEPVAEPVPAPEERPAPVETAPPEPAAEIPETPAIQPAPTPEYHTTYPVALRTNLLSDIVLMPNLGIEVPLGKHFSVAGDFAYAYWRIDNTYALQTIQGNLEGRYWFDTRKGLLTGWSVGVYGTYGGRYDVQWEGGYQGDSFFTAGLTGGWAMPLSEHFHLDFSLAAGYFFTPEVRRYERPQEGHLIWKETRYDVGRFSLTKARVSLVWLWGIRNINRR